MDELSAIRHKLSEHARRVLEDEELLVRAWEINQQDKARVAQYLPVQKQAAQAQTQTQAQRGSTLGTQQRMAIGVIKEANKDEKEKRPAASTS
jgi:hypothetical protein